MRILNQMARYKQISAQSAPDGPIWKTGAKNAGAT
jgi:hypothetical protein